MKPANTLLSSFGTTVFEVMSRLAIEHKSINLGQGFPDDRGPDPVLAEASKALYDPPNQYPPMLGVPELRQAVAAHDKRFYGLDVDWQTETMVSTGATEGLAACFFGLIEPGDEVVLIEPCYDCYLPIIRRAGGIPKMVTIRPPDWSLDPAALRAAFSDKTKLIVLNTPQNPASKVFTQAEMEMIAGLVREFDCYAVCDEAYEHLAFDGRAHIPLMTLPGMRERCVRIGSAGKTFSLTGWKVGYLTAPPHLLAPIAKAHQFLVFTTAPNLQRAVAFGLAQGDDYFDELASTMQAKRDRLSRGLSRAGFGPVACEGTYFLFVDISELGFDGDDEAFCRHITTEAGVTAVPVSAFYREDGPRNYIRFCFAKQDEVLDAAVDKLARHFG
ncbi:MAG: aminotransferase [Rhodospirillaceae bacterium]|jgi:N-succinyldiaminopimelate aminotransferase|nr:aminotransferase [Rhodospirillaceae bacterium]MBT6137112.1 aminotransferase [Rhodospirillaceae bacterium]